MREHVNCERMLTSGTCDPWTERRVSQGSELWAAVVNGNCRWGYVCSESAVWTPDQTHTWSACFSLTSPESAHDEPQPAAALQTTIGQNVCHYCKLCYLFVRLISSFKFIYWSYIQMSKTICTLKCIWLRLRHSTVVQYKQFNTI